MKSGNTKAHVAHATKAFNSKRNIDHAAHASKAFNSGRTVKQTQNGKGGGKMC